MIETILAIGLHLGTAHSNITTGYSPNDFNPGVYVETVDNYSLGMYYNSDKKSTIYVGKTLHYSNVSLLIGVATGYNKPLTPAIIPSIKIPITKDFSSRFWYIPKYNSGASGVHMSIEWRM